MKHQRWNFASQILLGSSGCRGRSNQHQETWKVLPVFDRGSSRIGLKLAQLALAAAQRIRPENIRFPAAES